MNSKLLKGSLAGVAALALAATGTTFAAYSDFGNINDNSLQAGILKIDLNNQNGSAATPLDFGNFNPGHSFVQNVWVASSNADSVPNANLSVTVTNVRDFENGCGSTNSEQLADPTCTASTDGDGTLGGEISPKLGTDMYAWMPSTPGQCANYPGAATAVSIWHSTPLKNTEGITKNISTSPGGHALNGGDGYCVRIEQYLPASTGNEVQSDSVKFDLRFDLEQV
jgi:predicted ribosomally synthesized peptide with SipW-like signal peptide